MHSGNQISDDIRNALLQVARDMIREKVVFIAFESDSCEGRVTTNGEHRSMGAISGQQFAAEVVTDAGTASVTFIVRTADLDEWGVGDGVWRNVPVFQPEPVSVRLTHEAHRTLQ
ncbi:MAG: hypothetical protein WCI89_03440 [bacterium]